MMENVFHHALKIDTDICTGCTLCMRSCPTQALKINQGKAQLIANKCIDCGECFRVCPVRAIFVEEDDFNLIYSYKRRVALVPSILISQFPVHITPQQIYSSLLEMGFTDVFEVENCISYLTDLYNTYISESDKKPIISSFCPAIVRLAQVKFPLLTRHIAKIKQPFEISAIFYRDYLINKGIKANDIGIFYVTPCAAQIAAVKSPVAINQSPIDGVINLDTLYNKISKQLLQKNKENCPVILDNSWMLDAEFITWSLTHGEEINYKYQSFAIDGIKNSIEFMELIESDRISLPEFLEMRACDESCAGGILTPINRFLAVNHLMNRAKCINSERTIRNHFPQRINEKAEWLHKYSFTEEIEPRKSEISGENLQDSINNLDGLNKLIAGLPGVDCSVCGFADCVTFASAVLNKEAELMQCTFIRDKKVFDGEISKNQVKTLNQKVWGISKFEKY